MEAKYTVEVQKRRKDNCEPEDFHKVHGEFQCMTWKKGEKDRLVTREPKLSGYKCEGR